MEEGRCRRLSSRSRGCQDPLDWKQMIVLLIFFLKSELLECLIVNLQNLLGGAGFKSLA